MAFDFKILKGSSLILFTLFGFSFKFSNNNSISFLFPEETLNIFAIKEKNIHTILTMGNLSAIIKNIFL